MPTPAARSLTAEELAMALDELRTLCSATVLDAVALHSTDGHDDVLLVLQAPAATRKTFLHVALGGQRARITTTQRRFGKDARARGPGADLLQRELQDATLRAIETVPGERRCTLVFDAPRGQRRLVIELFSARGLWLLGDAQGIALTMSRPVETAVRTLRRNDVYVPPPPAPVRASPANKPSVQVRFTPPVLAAIDEHFTSIDLLREQQHAASSLRVAAERARKKAQHKAFGMRRQLDHAEGSSDMRATADLMLAYAHGVARGAASMEVPSLDGESSVTIPLDPQKPVTLQANQLYKKARRLDDGKAVTERRLGEAHADIERIDAILQLLTEPSDDDVEAARTRLLTLGLLPKAKTAAKPSTASGRKNSKHAPIPFRRFSSAEGYELFVGRNNNQNDDLTMRFAKGNDLWLHVGGGRPGSHVVVRLPKQKTASLETLLDAATLAVYYSKSRGEPRIDVIYTFRKNIKKPKGLPPGAVVPVQTKTITVQQDDDRLQRLLASSQGSDD